MELQEEIKLIIEKHLDLSKHDEYIVGREKCVEAIVYLIEKEFTSKSRILNFVKTGTKQLIHEIGETITDGIIKENWEDRQADKRRLLVDVEGKIFIKTKKFEKLLNKKII